MQADFNTGAYASWGPTVANRVPVHGAGPYKVANVWNRTRAVYTNDTPAGAFRGFGIPQSAIANETLLDDLAERLGLDRWAIRRINALGVGDKTYTGQVLASSAGLPQCLDALEGDWDAALARASAHNAAGPRRRRGVGIACMWYGCGNTSLSNPSTCASRWPATAPSPSSTAPSISARARPPCCLQIAADALGLPPSSFRMIVGDTDLTADAGKTSASRQTFVSGNAARLAGEDLRRRILALANAGPDAKLQLDRARLTIADGDASREVDLAVIPAERAAREPGPRGGKDNLPWVPDISLTRNSGMTDVILEGHGTWDPPTTWPRRERPGHPLRHLRLRRADGRGGGRHPARHRQGDRDRRRPTTSAAPSTRRWWRARSTAASPKAWASR
jgi:CO/xanthine dehydrogenase Mo-binding subunit